MLKEIITTANEKMTKTVTVLQKEFTTMKAGRANPAILDKIEAEYYGSMTALNSLANISIPEARIIMITPYDKTSIKAIEKAILKSDLGLNPSSDGTVIRLIIPELTEETRKNIVKNVKKYGEDAKVAVRAIRRDCNDKIKALKKESELSEDEIKKSEDEIQKKTDLFIKEIDKLVETKEKEIMTV